jgi:hypothetical protein
MPCFGPFLYAMVLVPPIISFFFKGFHKFKGVASTVVALLVCHLFPGFVGWMQIYPQMGDGALLCYGWSQELAHPQFAGHS